MRIRKIKISNFRNLRNLEVYPAETTVLIGENNTGKSNLLHALRLLLDPDAKRLEYELSEEDINDFARQEGENSFSITLEIGDLQEHQELECIFKDCIAQDEEETYVTIEGKYEPDEEGIYNFKVKVLSPPGRYSDPLPFFDRMRRHIPLYYLDAVRDAEREMRATGRGALAQLLSGIELEDVEEDIITHIQNANKALSRNQDINDLARNIKGLLSPHIPGGEGDISITVATEDPTQLIKGLRLCLKRQSDVKAYDMYRHGTGLQNLVLIAMFRHRVFADERVQPILAIEEPESHLHPQALRCLFKDLEGIDRPVLLTTHSPAIVECCNPLGLVRLASADQSQVRAHQLDRSQIDGDYLNFLGRMMRSGRAEAFFARAIIVVEGPSDAVALSAFASQIGCSLDREGISVIQADGNSFLYIQRSCNSNNFSIPMVVTFDTDALEKGPGLLKEAFKAGLIDKKTFDSGKKEALEFRQKILEGIGWIPVIRNLEEEIARIGYLPLILEAIDNAGNTPSLVNFLTEKNLEKNANGVAEFINGTKPGKRLKVPIAYAVANGVEIVGKVPDCFTRAIEKAVELAESGEIAV
ncbi:MAG: AAA family ATPase [Candidatus Methanofastidiosia archaeon]